MIPVFNKIDLINGDTPVNGGEVVNIGHLKSNYRKNGHSNAAFISVTKKDNIGELREVIFNKVAERHYQIFPNYLKPQVY